MLCAALQSASSTVAAGLAALPDVWRASELAVSRAVTQSTGHPTLDAELPNQGWPQSSLTELLLLQPGIGELQLLKPIIARLSKNQRIALVQPPHLPNPMAFKAWGIDTDRILWIKAPTTSNALWTAEQILKNGSCGAVILWQTNVRAESLRRLNLAAQSTDTWFWLMRPMAGAAEASPAPLRLALRPALGGVAVEILKRRGPAADEIVFVSLPDMPTGRHPLHHENPAVHQYSPALVTARNAAPVLV